MKVESDYCDSSKRGDTSGAWFTQWVAVRLLVVLAGGHEAAIRLHSDAQVDMDLGQQPLVRGQQHLLRMQSLKFRLGKHSRNNNSLFYPFILYQVDMHLGQQPLVRPAVSTSECNLRL